MHKKLEEIIVGKESDYSSKGGTHGLAFVFSGEPRLYHSVQFDPLDSPEAVARKLIVMAEGILNNSELMEVT